MIRKVLIADDEVLSYLRNEEGYAIHVEWGKPDAEDFYTPTFTIDYSDRLNVVERGEDYGE